MNTKNAFLKCLDLYNFEVFEKHLHYKCHSHSMQEQTHNYHKILKHHVLSSLIFLQVRIWVIFPTNKLVIIMM
jgi:hypothetical protein